MPDHKLNAKDQRLMEEKISLALETDNEITDEEIDAIKQSAYEDYMNAQAYRQKSNQRKEKTRTIAKRLVAVAAIAIILFVAPFVYSVLMPVTMSKADNFMRQAAIWMNDTFHLGIDVSAPVPKDDQSNVKTEHALVDPALEDLAAASTLPIVYLPTNETITLDSVTHNNELLHREQIIIQYKINNDDIIVIKTTPMQQSATMALDDGVIQLQTEAGTAFFWSADKVTNAVIYSSEYKITIFSSLTLEDLIFYCSALSILN